VAVAFALVFVAVIIMANTGTLGPLDQVYDVRYGDKAGHFVMLGMLALLTDLALFRLAPRRGTIEVVFIVGAALAALIALEELSQLWVPRRNPDPFDLLASWAGIVAGSLVAATIATRPLRRSRV
jgi:hypothetical protein